MKKLILITKFQQLEWDSNFFGFEVAKYNNDISSQADFEDVCCSLKANNVKLCYLFVDPDSQMDKILKKNQVFLADEKITYFKNINSKINVIIDKNIQLNAESKVSEKMLDIAIQTSEYSRFRIDKKLPENAFKELYFKWIQNAVNDKESGELFVYKDNNVLKGLIYLKEINEKNGSISLIGVDQGYRGEQIGSKLIQKSEEYFKTINKNELQVVTQKANKLACRFYEKNGFKVRNITNVYHLWL